MCLNGVRLKWHIGWNHTNRCLNSHTVWIHTKTQKIVGFNGNRTRWYGAAGKRTAASPPKENISQSSHNSIINSFGGGLLPVLLLHCDRNRVLCCCRAESSRECLPAWRKQLMSASFCYVCEALFHFLANHESRGFWLDRRWKGSNIRDVREWSRQIAMQVMSARKCTWQGERLDYARSIGPKDRTAGYYKRHHITLG